MKDESQMDLVVEQLQTRGIVSATVSDGKVFFFSRAVLQELLQRVDARHAEYASLFIPANGDKPKFLN